MTERLNTTATPHFGRKILCVLLACLSATSLLHQIGIILTELRVWPVVIASANAFTTVVLIVGLRSGHPLSWSFLIFPQLYILEVIRGR